MTLSIRPHLPRAAVRSFHHGAAFKDNTNLEELSELRLGEFLQVGKRVKGVMKRSNFKHLHLRCLQRETNALGLILWLVVASSLLQLQETESDKTERRAKYAFIIIPVSWCSYCLAHRKNTQAPDCLR